MRRIRPPNARTEQFSPALRHRERGTPPSGVTLDQRVRTPLETRLGHSFADVRVHADAGAASAAAALDAAAFAVGPNLIFGAGEYAPGTRRGALLLAHELAHVVQFDRAGGRTASGEAEGAEREAQEAAVAVAVGEAPAVGAGPPAPVATGMLDWLEETAGSAVAEMGDVAGGAWDAASELGSDIYGGMKAAGGAVHDAQHWVESGIDTMTDTSKSGWGMLAESAEGIPVLEELAGGAGWLGEQSAGFTGGLLKGATGLLGGVSGMVANPVDTAIGLEGMAEHARIAPGVANPLQVIHGLYNAATTGATLTGELNRTLNPVEIMAGDIDFGGKLLGGLARPYIEAYDKGDYAGMAGRGAFDIGMLLLGVGEAEAAAGGAEALGALGEAAEGSSALGALGEAAEGTGALSALEAAGEGGEALAALEAAGEGSEAVAALEALGEAAPPRHFWTGGEAAESAAQAVAQEAGGLTLDMTAEGRAAAEQAKAMEAAGAGWPDIRAQAWEPASEAFAEGASGTPTAHVNNLNPASVWSEVEFPALMNNPAVEQLAVKYMPGAAALTEELWFAMGDAWSKTGKFFPPGLF